MYREPLLCAAVLLAPVLAAAAPACPTTWSRTKTGDCMWNTSYVTGTQEEYYVHPGGWLVRKNCHDRFGFDSFNASLAATLKKLKPSVGASAGGCMSVYNSQKGQDWMDRIWTSLVIVTCEPPPTGSDACGATSTWSVPNQGSAQYHVVAVLREDKCSDGGGLPAILFHETLHALSVATVSGHNNPNGLKQQDFIQDRVYGAEAVCYYGFDNKTKDFVSYFQCNDLMDGNDPRDVCKRFSNSVSDHLPPGLNKREGP